MNDWKYPCITVTSGMSGFFAVMLVWNDEYGGFAEPEETGEGRYADQAAAIQEAEAWAEAEDVPFYPPKLVTEPARQDVVAQLLEIFPDMQVIELPARPVQQNSTGGKSVRTMETAVSEWLCNKGLWPDEAAAVIGTMKNGSQAAEFEKRWSESADDPAQASVLAAFLFVAKFTAIGWLAIHKPHHFALTLLEKEARNE